jgi:hypothetical protein
MNQTGYITLPSNEKDTNTENTTTRYITNFDQPIKLDGLYEIALVEAIYKQSWFVPVGFVNYSYSELGTPVNWIKIPILFYDSENIIHFCKRINDQMKTFILVKIYNSRFELSKIIKNLKNENDKETKFDETLYPKTEYDLSNKIKNKQSVIEDIKKNEREYVDSPTLIYHNKHIIIEFKNKIQAVTFEGDIASILKCEIFNNIINESKVFNASNNLNQTSLLECEIDLIDATQAIYLLGTLFIYSDIADYVYYGSRMMPLLRTLVIDYKTPGRTLISHFDTPHYIKINKEEINSILIDIRDQEGRKIYFDNSQIAIKLHYRPISLE